MSTDVMSVLHGHAIIHFIITHAKSVCQKGGETHSLVPRLVRLHRADGLARTHTCARTDILITPRYTSLAGRRSRNEFRVEGVPAPLQRLCPHLHHQPMRYRHDCHSGKLIHTLLYTAVTLGGAT